MKKIDFKQQKYMLAFITMPFVILIAYFISLQFNKKGEEELQLPTNLEVVEGLNSNLPDPDLSNREVKDKFGAYQDAYKKQKDYSAISTDIKEDKEIEPSMGASIYTEDEINDIQSQHERNAAEARRVKMMQRKFFNGNNIDDEPKGKESAEMKRLKEQLELIDSLKNFGNISENKKKETPKVQVQEEPIIEAVKAENVNAQYFNSLKKDSKESFITAILDEAETVKDGSRIRIRLLDDILLGDNHLKKGTYLYGLVNGFKGQRVVININSILYENRIINTNITLYDNDGIKGLYVPQSDFREIMQAATAQLGQQQMTFDDGTNNLQEFAYGALQDIYRTTTQALTKKIKQNKAKLKYNTVVFLINEKDNKKRK